MTQIRVNSSSRQASEFFTYGTTSSVHLTKRLAISLGGFLILVGLVMIVLFSLLGLGTIDGSIVNRIFDEEPNQQLFLCFLFIIGVLDILAGFILKQK